MHTASQKGQDGIIPPNMTVIRVGILMQHQVYIASTAYFGMTYLEVSVHVVVC